MFCPHVFSFSLTLCTSDKIHIVCYLMRPFTFCLFSFIFIIISIFVPAYWLKREEFTENIESFLSIDFLMILCLDSLEAQSILHFIS